MLFSRLKLTQAGCLFVGMGLMLMSSVGCVSGEEVNRRMSWRGRNIVFLGDSITDPIHVGCETNYWGFLAERMGFPAYVYGKNGWQMSGVGRQLEFAKKELGDHVDAIFIFMGTNDFNDNVPRGDWFEECEEVVLRTGGEARLKKREFSYDAATFRGRMNLALRNVKCAYPKAQVILLTPLHRGYAAFGPENIQPDERYANRLGLYIHDYVEDIVKAGKLWSVPVIDLFGESGILPNERECGFYMARPDGTDRLHPSTEGHDRIARVIEARLRSFPPSFR